MIENNCSYPQTNTFSFKEITENNKYNFNYFESSKSEALNASIQFHELLRKMSSTTIASLLTKDKQHGGVEHLDRKVFKLRLLNSLKYNVLPDEKLYVVRFNSQRYRMIFRRGKKCGRVLHILAFEFELGLAYEHD